MKVLVPDNNKFLPKLLKLHSSPMNQVSSKHDIAMQPILQYYG